MFNNTNYIIKNQDDYNTNYNLWLNMYKLTLSLLYTNLIKDLDNNFSNDGINLKFEDFCKFVYKHSSKEMLIIYEEL
jgi:hypothetical protein